MNTSDWILLATLVAIVWYTCETRSLKHWQKRQVMLTILQMEVDRRTSSAKGESVGIGFLTKWPDYLHGILEKAELDLRSLFSPVYSQKWDAKKSFKQKIFGWFKKM